MLLSSWKTSQMVCVPCSLVLTCLCCRLHRTDLFLEVFAVLHIIVQRDPKTSKDRHMVHLDCTNTNANVYKLLCYATDSFLLQLEAEVLALTFICCSRESRLSRSRSCAKSGVKNPSWLPCAASGSRWCHHHATLGHPTVKATCF